MAGLEMKIHLQDFEEVTRLVESAGSLVEMIESANFVCDSGLPLKWTAQYVDFRNALIKLTELTKNRSQSASLETV